MNGKLFVISGPSGSGKTTLANHVMSEFNNLKFSVSCTTRQKRQNEIDGVDYFFVSRVKFKEMIDKGMFAEWALVHGNYYGTPLKNIKEAVNKGMDILLDIDVQGASQLKDNIEDAVFIFVVPPSIELLEERLKKRNLDKKEDISLRMNVVKQEIEQAKEYDYIIINDDINTAKEAIKSIIIAEKSFKNSNDDEIQESLIISDRFKSSKIYGDIILNKFELN
ncbi:MAG: guanylate kinase [Candidatus Dadabacteria bacterium]|nr:guanylate kinase [Candidatus Dadabacteria bacterium]NIQ16345.1 guanylate kinase [Candidatus Dadabacteria bacterium]